MSTNAFRNGAARIMPFFWPLHALIAEAQSPFTEEALERGVNYLCQSPSGTAFNFGYGVAFVDLDNDLDPDLVTLGRSGGRVGVFENTGGTFIDRSTTTQIPFLPAASGVTAADFDGDGDQDLYIACWLSANALLRNDGNFTFTNVAAAAGVADAGAGVGCAWADYDLDGRVDLYLANRTGSQLPSGAPSPERNRLYRNRGNGTFENLAPTLGVEAADEPTFQAVFFDYDADGAPDLYLSTDKGYIGLGQNHLFMNNLGAFTDVTAASGTGAMINSMGVAVGDFNGNGFQDLYCTNTPEGNPLYINQGTGAFLEQSAAAGVQSFRIGWAACFLDYNHDARPDLFVCNMGSENRLYATGSAWPCIDVAPALQVNDPGPSFCMAAADIDDDGDLDIVVQNNGQRIKLLINHEDGQRRWARFKIIGLGNNTGAIGAIGANVAIRANEAWQRREIFAGTSYKSHNELIAHFGLNQAQIIDEAVVTWLGGATRTLFGLDTNRLHIVYPAEQLADYNANGQMDPGDVPDFAAVLLGNNTDPFDRARADITGDGRADARDIAAFTACATAGDCPD